MSLANINFMFIVPFLSKSNPNVEPFSRAHTQRGEQQAHKLIQHQPQPGAEQSQAGGIGEQVAGQRAEMCIRDRFSPANRALIYLLIGLLLSFLFKPGQRAAGVGFQPLLPGEPGDGASDFAQRLFGVIGELLSLIHI